MFVADPFKILHIFDLLNEPPIIKMLYFKRFVHLNLMISHFELLNLSNYYHLLRNKQKNGIHFEMNWSQQILLFIKSMIYLQIYFEFSLHLYCPQIYPQLYQKMNVSNRIYHEIIFYQRLQSLIQQLHLSTSPTSLDLSGCNQNQQTSLRTTTLILVNLHNFVSLTETLSYQ